MDVIKNIYYLTASREIEIIRNLAINKKKDASGEDDKSFFKEHIFDKLFIERGSRYYLKNKYLYMFTEGAMKFINANSSMGEGKNKLYEIEKQALKDLIIDISRSYNKINVLSLGAGVSRTEIDAIESAIITDVTLDVNFYALDVSLYLLYLGISDFVRRCNDPESNPKIKKINFEGIIADIWDAADNKKNAVDKLIDRDKVTIFTFFGGTIGNYPEKEIMEKIISLMNANDFLLVGYDVWKASNTSNHNKNKISDEILKKYSNDRNIEWLTQPLNQISQYQGLTGSLKFRNDVLTVSTKDNELNIITNVPNSIAYVPEVELKNNKIRLAHSTKYYAKDFFNNPDDNEFNKYIKKIKCKDGDKIKTLLLKGTLSTGDDTKYADLGFCVSKFICEEDKVKRRKRNYGGTGER